MDNDEMTFGNFLREMIKQTGISQSTFYLAVKITKPYFYDILSGKVNPPPSEIQFKMLDNLKVTEEQRLKFLNLAAAGRREIPSDIVKLILEHPSKLEQIRIDLVNLLETQNKELINGSTKRTDTEN